MSASRSDEATIDMINSSAAAVLLSWSFLD